MAILLVLVLAGSVAGARSLSPDSAPISVTAAAADRQAVPGDGSSARHAPARPSRERPAAGPEPQCSDGVDNPDREDALADAEDPGCHSDGDASNAASYDPDGRTEQDRRPSERPDPTPTPSPTATPSPTPTATPGPTQATTCRASVVRIGSFEPLAAGGSPCESDSAGGPTIYYPEDVPLIRVTLPHASADDSGSSTTVAHFDLFDPIAPDPDRPLVHAELLSASTGCGGGDSLGPSGGSKVAQIWVGEVLLEPGRAQTVEAGPLATVHTNHMVEGDRSVTVRALFIDTHGPLEDLVGDIAVAEASFAEPPGFECSAGGSRGH